MVSRTVILILVASLMGSQGAPHQEQFDDRQFSGLPYGGVLPYSQDYVAAQPAAPAPMGSYASSTTAAPYAAPPAPVNNYPRPPNQVAYQSAPAHNYPRPATYQAAPQPSPPSASIYPALAPYQPAMSASAYPVGAPAAPASYNSYSAPSTAAPSYQYPTTTAAPYAALPSVPASYTPARPAIQATYQVAPSSAPYAAAPVPYQPAMSAPAYPSASAPASPVAATPNTYNYSSSSTSSY